MNSCRPCVLDVSIETFSPRHSQEIKMQKTVLAVALASVFSVGTAYAATELMGESTSALLHSKEAKGDYVLSLNVESARPKS